MQAEKAENAKMPGKLKALQAQLEGQQPMAVATETATAASDNTASDAAPGAETELVSLFFATCSMAGTDNRTDTQRKKKTGEDHV